MRVVLFAAAFAVLFPVGAQEQRQPLTPGAVALSILDDDVSSREELLRAALGDDDPFVRLAAARVVGVSRLSDLTADVVEALARESHEAAEAEEMRALLLIARADSLAAADAHLSKVQAGAAATLVFAQWLARHDYAAFVRRYDELAGRLEGRLFDALVTAGHHHAETRSQIEAWWLAARAEGERSRKLPWLPADVENEPKGLSAVSVSANWPARQSPMVIPPPLWPSFWSTLLEAAECPQRRGADFGAVGLTFGGDGRPLEAQIDRGQLPGNCGDALSALARLSIADPSAPVSPGFTQWVIMPVARGFVTCADSAAAGGEGPWTKPVDLPAGNEIKEPRKTHDVRPEYPTVAQIAKVEGTVIVDSTISRDGCVIDARIVRSVHVALDYAALRAVSQWRFTPTLLNGQPVEVQMTVTVNFTLR